MKIDESVQECLNIQPLPPVPPANVLKNHFIKFNLVNGASNEALEGVNIALELPNGEVSTADRSDEKGDIELDYISSGNCKIISDLKKVNDLVGREISIDQAVLI